MDWSFLIPSIKQKAGRHQTSLIRINNGQNKRITLHKLASVRLYYTEKMKQTARLKGKIILYQIIVQHTNIFLDFFLDFFSRKNCTFLLLFESCLARTRRWVSLFSCSLVFSTFKRDLNLSDQFNSIYKTWYLIYKFSLK